MTGAAGLLGRDLVRLARRDGHDVVALTRAELDVTDAAAVAVAVADLGRGAIINCAAYTDVDGAESHEAEATRVNGQGAGNVARAACARGVRLLHVGSDYVFAGDGPTPRTETDATAPRSAYGRSKLAGEREVLAAGGEATIVRSAWLYGSHGRNFVDAIRAKAASGTGPLKVVNDQVGSPTWSVTLARGLLRLLAVPTPAVIHCASTGAVSWYDLARAIVSELGVDAPIDAISTAELGRPAPRPRYSALDTGLYRKLTGLTPPSWRESLGRYLGGHDDEG